YALSVVAIEVEVARDAGRDYRRQLVKRRMSRRIDTIIGGSCSDLKLHTVHPLAGRENVSCRPLAVSLLEPILQAYLRVAADQALDLIEINDDVIALADAEATTRELHGRGQRVSSVALS